jgi:hypothetical protein
VVTITIFDVAHHRLRRALWRSLNRRGFVRLFENVAAHRSWVERVEVKRAFIEALGRAPYRVVVIRLRRTRDVACLSDRGGRRGR